MDGKLKPWQIVLFVAALGAVGFAVYSSVTGAGPVNLRDRFEFVDMTTGELITIDRKGKTLLIPCRNPATDKYTLLPVQKGDDGKYRIMDRYLPMLSEIEGEPTALVNRKTGEVAVRGS
ncbi:MAG: hypothetical protein RBS39_05035 [Phycisphaerales bacterium]|jgi:hypothetical protein|nr:hypothetical protein [Phycisphaerales bacterium]